MDKLSPQQRHDCMASIRSKDTKPELVVLKYRAHLPQKSNITKPNDQMKIRQTTKLYANLNSLAEKIDTTKMKKPSFKMVLTAVGQYAYIRTDGVMVVPIGCLKD